MTKRKRIVSAMIVLCLAVGLVVSPVGGCKVQAETFTDGDFEYEILPDGTVGITEYAGAEIGLGGEADRVTVVQVPEQIDGRPVTSIGYNVFLNKRDVVEVHIPAGVTNLGSSSYPTICLNCPKITAIHVADDNAYFSSVDGVLFDKQKTEIIKYPEGKKGAYSVPASVTSIGIDSFSGTSGLTGITIPSTVTDIGYGAFHNCKKLTGIELPASITDIGGAAFSYCSGLTSITISSGATSIGYLSFSYCSSLESVTIPLSVTEIKNAAFYECTNLKNVYYSGSKEQWEKIKIGKAGVSGIDSSIHTNAALVNAAIHLSDGTILNASTEDYLYQDLDDDTVEITKYIGSDEILKIPAELDGKRVVKIGDKAFQGENIKEVSLPASVTMLDGYSFENCINLSAVYVDAASDSYVSEDGILFNKEKTELVIYPCAKSGGYVIQDSIRKIGDSAFRDCKNLTEIVIPEGMEEIGYSAFSGCIGISCVVIPQSVKMIGNHAFATCTNLKEINILSQITEIQNSVFYGCSSLKEIEIPDGVTQIGFYAFYHCENLKKITIPVSVVKISRLAFSVTITISNLEDVYYKGTQDQWDSIEVTGDGSGLTGDVKEKLRINANIHFLGDPQPDAQPETLDARQELERLKANGSFGLQQDFGHYLSKEQIDIMESCLYTWLAEVNASYKYSGPAAIRELLMKKSGIDPNGDPMSGMEKAIMHITAETTYGPKTFEFTLDIGKPDSSGNLYPAYGAMQYEILEKNGIPSDLPKSGAVGRTSYADLGAFAESVRKASEDSLYSTYQWQQLNNEMIAGILADKTVTEIIGNKNGYFSDGTMTVYAKPLFTYSKKVTIACPVDVYIYGMDGTEAGTIINNKPSGGNGNVRLEVNGDSKTVYLSGNDYYLNLRGTDTGTMRYEVEEIANEEVRRNVQFLELQLKKDMQYEGYVFRPLNIDSDLYALRTAGGSSQEVFYADQDTYQALFKRIQGLALSQKNTSLEADKTVQLNASLSPLDASNPNLKWITDNESVAKVDNNGLVTAVGAGRATVTVATKDGSFLKQFCVIDVADKTGNNSGSAGSGSGGASGWYGGGNAADTEEKTPVVVKLHYVVQFQANGGTNLSRKTMTLLAGDSPGIMPKVQRKDYLFDGWYTQMDDGERVTGEEPLKEAATLYARWKKAEAPAKVSAPVLKSKKKGQIQVDFKQVKGAAGYQIQYSTNKDFTSGKTKDAAESAKSKVISGLKAGKKYYVRMRAYVVDSMKNRTYGAYGAVKSLKVKS